MRCGPKRDECEERDAANIANIDKIRDDAGARFGHNPKGRGDLGAFRRRAPLQYSRYCCTRPPRTASHIASVAHVPIIEIGSSLARDTLSEKCPCPSVCEICRSLSAKYDLICLVRDRRNGGAACTVLGPHEAFDPFQGEVLPAAI
jgi:hypothetical protein